MAKVSVPVLSGCGNEKVELPHFREVEAAVAADRERREFAVIH